MFSQFSDENLWKPLSLCMDQFSVLTKLIKKRKKKKVILTKIIMVSANFTYLVLKLMGQKILFIYDHLITDLTDHLYLNYEHSVSS